MGVPYGGGLLHLITDAEIAKMYKGRGVIPPNAVFVANALAQLSRDTSDLDEKYKVASEYARMICPTYFHFVAQQEQLENMLVLGLPEEKQVSPSYTHHECTVSYKQLVIMFRRRPFIKSFRARKKVQLTA